MRYLIKIVCSTLILLICLGNYGIFPSLDNKNPFWTEAVDRSSTFTISLVEENDGINIDYGVVDLQYSLKSEASLNNREWFTFNRMRLKSSEKSFTLRSPPENVDFRAVVVELPLGYKVDNKIINIEEPYRLEIDVKRDKEGVNEAVEKAKFDLHIHTVPPVRHAKFYIKELSKPDNNLSSRNNEGFSPNVDLGGIFANWRKREDMISFAQPVHPSRKRSQDSDGNALSELVDLSQEAKKSENTQKAASTQSNGVAKILNLSFDKWYRFMRIYEQLDDVLDFVSERKAYWENGESKYKSISYYVIKPNLENYIGYITSDLGVLTTYNNVENEDNFIIRGPRAVNKAKTKYVYDVYVKTAENGNLEEAIKDEYRNKYSRFLGESASVSLDDEADIEIALKELEESGEEGLAEEKEKLEKIKEALEKEKEKERKREAKENAEAKLTEAEEKGTDEAIKKAEIAIEALDEDEPAKANLLEKLEKLKELLKKIKDYKEQHEKIANTGEEAIRIEDKDKVEKALTDYEGLSEQAKEKLRGLKAKLDNLKAKIEEKEREKKASDYRNKHSEIINKPKENLVVADGNKIDEALHAYDMLEGDVKPLLRVEKEKLDILKREHNLLKQANNFKEKYRDLIEKDVNALTLEDKDKLERLKNEWEGLSEEVKEKVGDLTKKLKTFDEKILELEVAKRKEELKKEAISKVNKALKSENENDIEEAKLAIESLENPQKGLLEAKIRKLEELLKEINDYKEQHEKIANTGKEAISIKDKDKIEKALADYEELSPEAKIRLEELKIKLDKLKDAILEKENKLNRRSNRESEEDDNSNNVGLNDEFNEYKNKQIVSLLNLYEQKKEQLNKITELDKSAKLLLEKKLKSIGHLIDELKLINDKNLFNKNKKLINEELLIYQNLLDKKLVENKNKLIDVNNNKIEQEMNKQIKEWNEKLAEIRDFIDKEDSISIEDKDKILEKFQNWRNKVIKLIKDKNYHEWKNKQEELNNEFETILEEAKDLILRKSNLKIENTNTNNNKDIKNKEKKENTYVNAIEENKNKIKIERKINKSGKNKALDPLPNTGILEKGVLTKNYYLYCFYILAFVAVILNIVYLKLQKRNKHLL